MAQVPHAAQANTVKAPINEVRHGITPHLAALFPAFLIHLAGAPQRQCLRRDAVRNHAAGGDVSALIDLNRSHQT